MKRYILLLVVIFSHSVFSQINDQVMATKITKVNPKALDPGIGPNNGVYPIISGKVSATPISIPSPENTPVRLQHLMERQIFSNNQSKINDCFLLRYLDDVLTVKILYTLGSEVKSDMPVYAGAWFYDKYDNAVQVGYIPQEITQRPSGSVIVQMGFKKYPVTTEKIKIMLLQDGKEIAARGFKAAFLWKESKPAMLKSTTVGTVINTGNINKYVPDLELTAIKVVDTDQNTLPYDTGCNLKDKIIFITNRGSRESSPYILSVGYLKIFGTHRRYTEVKRIAMPSLLPGVQTSRTVVLPTGIDNIRAEIIYNYNTNGETNTRNNSMEKQCISIK